MSGQLLLARTSPVTARVGKAVIKEAAKVVAARGLAHGCRIGPQRTCRQARSLVDGAGMSPPRKNGRDPRVIPWGLSALSLGSLRAVVQAHSIPAQPRAIAERELAQRSEALNSGLFVLHGAPPPVRVLGCSPTYGDGLFDRRAGLFASPVPCVRARFPGKSPTEAAGTVVYVRPMSQNGCVHATAFPSRFTGRSGGRRR